MSDYFDKPIIIKYNEMRKENIDFMYISKQKLEILEQLYIMYLLMMNVVQIKDDCEEYDGYRQYILNDREEFRLSIQELAEDYGLGKYDFEDPILSYEHAGYYMRQKSELHPTVIDSYIEANKYYVKNYIEPHINTTIH